MAKFKKGERVIIINVNKEDTEVNIKCGMTATVLDDSDCPYLNIDNWETNYDGYGIDANGNEFNTVCWSMDELNLKKMHINE